MHSNQNKPFENREEAGSKLAKRLSKFAQTPNVIVLALPNGGVPVGAKIASLLNLPFDILLLENITAPGYDDEPLGAVTAGGVRVLNSAMIDRLDLSQSEINAAILRGCQKLARREKTCRGHAHPLEIADNTVFLVDDGTTPCAVIRDAIHLLRRQHADRIIVALPVACRHNACDLRFEADEVVTLVEPPTPRPVDHWFKKQHQTTDAEVRHIVAGNRATVSA